MSKKLYLNKKDAKIPGVCAGVADYFDIDVTLIRVFWISSVLMMGFGLLPYIILALVVPSKEEE